MWSDFKNSCIFQQFFFLKNMNLTSPIWISHVWNFGPPYETHLRGTLGYCIIHEFLQVFYEIDLLNYVFTMLRFWITPLLFKSQSYIENQIRIEIPNLSFPWPSVPELLKRARQHFLNGAKPSWVTKLLIECNYSFGKWLFRTKKYGKMNYVGFRDNNSNARHLWKW